MSTKKSTTEEITAITKLAADQAALMTTDFDKQLVDGDFIEDQSIKIGDPEKGSVPRYAGLLIGPGPDIELNDGEGTMPTWQFHPLGGSIKAPVANERILHNVICSANLDSACKRAQALSQSTGKKIFMLMEYAGQGKNRAGQPLNQFRVAMRMV